MPAYRLISVAEIGEGVARRTDSPMVGRERARTLLSSFDEALTKRGCRLVTVIGEAGVGKSRLHEEFCTVGERAQVLRGRCSLVRRGHHVLAAPRSDAAGSGIRDDDPPDVAIAKLVALVGEGRRCGASRRGRDRAFQRAVSDRGALLGIRKFVERPRASGR